MRLRAFSVAAAGALACAVAGCINTISGPTRVVEVTTGVSNNTIRAGDSIVVTVSVENTAVDPVTILGARNVGGTWTICPEAFVVRDRTGAVVGPSDGACDLIGADAPLEGGQIATFTTRWPGTRRSSGSSSPTVALPPDDYEVLARVRITTLGTVDGVAIPVRITP